MSKLHFLVFIAILLSFFSPLQAAEIDNPDPGTVQSTGSADSALTDANSADSDLPDMTQKADSESPVNLDEAEENADADSQSEADENATATLQLAKEPALPPPPPEKDFINPWLMVIEATLRNYLSQNWFIEEQLKQRRQLGLALAAAGKPSRRFRQETELLLRDPGFRQMYTSLSLFPKLVLSDIRNSLKLNEFLARNLAARKITISKALNEVEAGLKLSFSILETADTMVAEIDKHLRDFARINQRKLRLSKLQNLIRKNNQSLIDLLGQQLHAFKALNSQHHLQLEYATTQLEYLKTRSSTGPIFIAARVARIISAIGDSQRNFADYLHQFIFFAARLKNILEQSFVELEKEALAVEKNRFHVLESLQNFPERDLHPQSLSRFSFKPFLQTHAALLDQQYQQLLTLEVSEIDPDLRCREEFGQTLSQLDGSLENFENFSDLFAYFYLPEPEEISPDTVSSATIEIEQNIEETEPVEN